MQFFINTIVIVVPIIICIITYNKMKLIRLEKSIDIIEDNVIDTASLKKKLTEDEIWHIIHDPIKLELYPIYNPHNRSLMNAEIKLGDTNVYPPDTKKLHMDCNINGSLYSNIEDNNAIEVFLPYTKDGVTWTTMKWSNVSLTIPNKIHRVQYIASKYITLKDPIFTVDGYGSYLEGIINAHKVNVRSSPNGTINTQLYQGTKVYVLLKTPKSKQISTHECCGGYANQVIGYI